MDPVGAEIVREKLKFNKNDKLKLGGNDYIVEKPTYRPTWEHPLLICGPLYMRFHRILRTDPETGISDIWRVIISGQLPEHEITS